MTATDSPATAGAGTPDRIRARAQARQSLRSEHSHDPHAHLPAWRRLLIGLRGWADALVFAYLLAMFIRIFVFELFMIPTGSMTPTLIGDTDRRVTFMDYDMDGIQDVIVRSNVSLNEFLVYVMGEDGVTREMLFLKNLPARITQEVLKTSPGRTDMILVNKFAYWFAEPKRDDIIVFKVPYLPDRPRGNPFDPYKPIFIKRCVALPGESVLLQPVDERDVPYSSPEFTGKQPWMRGGMFERKITGRPMIVNGEALPPDSMAARVIHYPFFSGNPSRDVNPQRVDAGPDGVLMFGDHQYSSSDSRDWGPVPVRNLRGKAILRYWPWKAFKILR